MRLSPLKSIPVALLLPVLTTGCGGKGIDPFDLIQQERAERAYKKAEALVLEDRPVTAAAYLWKFASKLPPSYGQGMRVHAANILLDANRPLNAYRYLLQISEKGMENKTLLRKRVAEALFYRQTDQPERITSALALNLIAQGNVPTRIIALELVGDALMLSNEFIRGIRLRLKRHKLLDEKRQGENVTALWQALLYLDPWQVKKALSDNPDSDVRRWLELAALATPLEMDREKFERDYIRWKRENRRWPLADSIVEELRARWQYLDYKPQKVALLLPLTGDYAKAGKAVKNGFFESYTAATTPDFTITVHNTDQPGSITSIYAKAIENEDIDMVIGPLLKHEVNTLISSNIISVPTISLNYTSTNTRTSENLFQFGLLPENEARQAARKIWSDGHEFIVVLAPDDDWGERLYRAFENEYSGFGGKIRALTRYDPNFVDYTAVIESLFELDRSRERHRLVASALGDKPNFTPRIRDDISASMLFADHLHAVMIFPQMKFHYVDKLPVYATSHIYKLGPLKGKRDLDGITYCDIPAIIQRKTFTDADEYARLSALGADAQRLAGHLRHMQIARLTFNGQTGKISISENQQLFSKLSWARFSRGRPMPLDAP